MSPDWWVAILALTCSAAGYGLALQVAPDTLGQWTGIGLFTGAGLGLVLAQALKKKGAKSFGGKGLRG
jgi:hypothetical protein